MKLVDEVEQSGKKMVGNKEITHVIYVQNTTLKLQEVLTVFKTN